MYQAGLEHETWTSVAGLHHQLARFTSSEVKPKAK